MKCQLKPTNHSERAVRVEFDRVIPPLFPRQQSFPGRMMHGDNDKVLFASTPAFRARHALRVARGNAGKFPFELVNPGQAYIELFERLAAIEGLVEVVDLDRYTLGIEVGGLFNVIEVARQLASVLQQSFYPDEEVEWGQGFQPPVIETLVLEPAASTESDSVEDPHSATSPESRIALGE